MAEEEKMKDDATRTGTNVIKSWLETRQLSIGNDIMIQNDVNYGEGSSLFQAKKAESIATPHKFH